MCLVAFGALMKWLFSGSQSPFCSHVPQLGLSSELQLSASLLMLGLISCAPGSSFQMLCVFVLYHYVPVVSVWELECHNLICVAELLGSSGSAAGSGYSGSIGKFYL